MMTFVGMIYLVGLFQNLSVVRGQLSVALNYVNRHMMAPASPYTPASTIA